MTDLVEYHQDPLGRRWAASKLDEMLTDAKVVTSATSVMAVGLEPSGGFCLRRAYGIALVRYRRRTSAALLSVLAARLWWLRQQGGGGS